MNQTKKKKKERTLTVQKQYSKLETNTIVRQTPTMGHKENLTKLIKTKSIKQRT